MRQSTRFILAATFAAGLVAAFVPNTAGAFDAAGQKCRSTIAKGGSKLTKTYAKTITGCQKTRDVTVSMSGTDCNDLAVADSALKLPSTEDKFASSVDKSCSTLTPADLLYFSCPAPCDAGTPTITTFADVSECLTCLGRSNAEGLGSSAFGLPTPALTGEELACHSAIQKNISKLYNTILKNVTKCQATDEKAGVSTVTNCTETQFNALVYPSYVKARDAVASACADVTLPSATLDACGGAATVDELAGCAAETAWAKGKIIVTDYLTLPVVVTTTTTTTTTLPSAAGCPDRGELTLYSKLSSISCTDNSDCTAPRTCDTTLGMCTTVATLDSGWTGLAQNSDINDGVTTRAVLQCPNAASPTCGACNVTGIDPEPGNCRCANNSRQVCGDPFASSSDDCPSCQGGPLNGKACAEDSECVVEGACARRCSNDVTTLCTADTDCSGGGTCPVQTKCANGATWNTSSSCTGTCEGTCSSTSACECFFGSPFPLNSGGTPACVVNRFSKDISGTADVDAGAGEISASLRSRVYLGPTSTSPCPTCNGDPVPDDGIRGGTCSGGDNAGQTCDATGYNASSPAQFGGSGGGFYSIDCLPSSGQNVSGAGLRIVLDQTTDSASLTANVSCGGDYPGLNCPCLVCSGDSSVPCNTDADCIAAGGTCSAKGSGVFPQPNQCDGGLCSDLGGGQGECTTGPDDKYCSGLLKADGSGILACSVDADCAPSAVGGAGGTCTVIERRRCFLDPIVAIGQADPNFPVAVSTFCVPPTSNGGINTVAGLPGPGRVISQGEGVTFCASDRNVQYQPGIGNCPP